MYTHLYTCICIYVIYIYTRTYTCIYFTWQTASLLRVISTRSPAGPAWRRPYSYMLAAKAVFQEVCGVLCIHACMQTYKHKLHTCITHIHTYIKFACTYVCMYVSTYVYICVCMYACMQVCMYVCMYVCLYECRCVCRHVCMYIRGRVCV